MAYTKQTWIDNQTVVTAAHMQHIEDGIETVENALAENVNQLSQLSEEILTKAPAIECESSGALVSITEAAARPAVSLISHIEHVQTGTGDSSPDNVQPIRGWDKVTAQRAGKNLASAYFQDPYFVCAGVDLVAGKTYTLSVSEPVAGLFFSSLDGETNYAMAYNAKTLTYTVEESRRYLLRAYFSDGKASLDINLKLELGSTATAYEPYNSQTLTADLPETVYGGTMDWTTGILTSFLDADGNELVEPKTFQLTPQQLDMLKGTNNVWSDTGDTSLVYVADTKSYIDNKFIELQNAILAQGANI